MNRKMTRKRTLLIVAVIAGCVIGNGTVTVAQSTHLTAASLGLGGGGTAYVDSYHANFVNPANLMLNDGVKPRFSIGIIGGLSTSAGGSLLNVSVYNDYFTKGLVLNGQVADEALTKWFGSDSGSMRNAGMQLDVVPIGMAYRSKNWGASLSLRSRVLANTGISRGFAELGIYGLDGDVFSTPRSINMKIETLAFHEVSLGYARKIISVPGLFGFARNVNLYAGVAPKMLLAAHASKMNFTSALLLEGASRDEIDLIRHEFSYSFETNGELTEQLRQFYDDRQTQDKTPKIWDYIDPQPEDMYNLNATGWGLDLGATLEMDLNVPLIGALFRGEEKLRVGLSLTDVGEVTFTDRVDRFVADDVLEWRGFTFDQERIDEDFNGSRSDYMDYVLQDSLAAEIYGSFAPAGLSQISRPLPSRVNFGAQLIMRKLSLSVDVAKGFDEQGTNSERVSLSGGLEYRLLGIMPLRVGMRTGGVSSTSYSAGLGLEFRNLEFSFAASTVPKSLNYGSSAGVAWSGLVFRF